jgi:hypothetical protein
MSYNFANYDAWLERPYQEYYAEQDHQLWVDENSAYETDCCGIDISYDDVTFESNGTPSSIKCPSCGEVAGLDVTPPVEYEPDPDDYEPIDLREYGYDF